MPRRAVELHTPTEEPMDTTTTKSTADDLTATVSFRLTDRERRLLEQRASDEDRSLGNYVRATLRKCLRDQQRTA